jgi:hypothetical protein
MLPRYIVVFIGLILCSSAFTGCSSHYVRKSQLESLELEMRQMRRDMEAKSTQTENKVRTLQARIEGIYQGSIETLAQMDKSLSEVKLNTHWARNDEIINTLSLEDGKAVYRRNKKELMVTEKRVDENFQKPPSVKIKTDEFKITNIKAESVNKDYIKDIGRREKLENFLRIYCRTFEEKNLAKFIGFFTDDAIEKGASFSSLLPMYQKNFEIINSISYKIELSEYFFHTNKGLVEIQGNFFAKWLSHGTDWKKNSGWISMSLVEHDDSFQIKRLDYNVKI